MPSEQRAITAILGALQTVEPVTVPLRASFISCTCGTSLTGVHTTGIAVDVLVVWLVASEWPICQTYSRDGTEAQMTSHAEYSGSPPGHSNP